ncbi:MAG: putative MutT/NUDIX-family protein [Actinomycetia bacterium]|nr:putative MutT/NUDIX-family protein [Actinomycetes bacterium]
MLRAAHLALLRIYRHLPRRARLAIIHGIAPSFSVGAICVIERSDGRVLVVRQSYRDRWGFPGGLLKRGEEAVDGARREAFEEVGLDIEVVGQPSVVVAPGPRRVDVIYRCRPAPGADPDTARPTSPEIVEVRWAPRDELPELQHEASGGLVALARASDPG